jgi:hypothetical protein
VLDDDVWRYVPVDPLVLLALGVVGLVAAVWVAVVRTTATRAVAVALLLLVVTGVVAVTLRPADPTGPGGFSWAVGESIRAELGSVNRGLGLVNVVGNVLMLVPVGWLAAVLAPRRRLLTGTVAALVLSAAVEVGQVVVGSVGDVDDLLLNGLGGLVGAAVAAGLVRLSGPRTTTGPTPVASGPS